MFPRMNARTLISRLGAFAAIRRRLSGFARAEGGAAAVETALVATPFFFLVFGILELAVVFLASASLDNATERAARTIRTGELQTGAAPTQAAFKQAICANFGWMQSSCLSDLYVDVRTFSSFQSVSEPQPLTNGVFDPSVLAFSPGGPSDVVVVRAYYEWPLVVPGLDQAMANISGGKRLMIATSTFRNEPYA
jgi:Flp pilus assembly protein TadG